MEGNVIAGEQPFNEEDYLEMNPDVRAAVRAGNFRSGRHHFDQVGRSEGRPGVAPYPTGAGRFFGEKPVDISALGELRAEKFPYAGPYPWLDRDDWPERIAAKVKAGELSPAEAELCAHWAREGYIIFPGLVEPAMIDRAWADYEDAARQGVIRLDEKKATPDDPYPDRYHDPHIKIPSVCGIMRHPEVLRWVKILMEREPAPYQPIIAHKGTQQAPHSDSIHMTTYPLGYLTAAWVALEDIHPDCGPLVYYPGSHRLPYVFSKEVGMPEGEFSRTKYKSYEERYEPWIGRLLAEHDCRPAYFHAGKGDVLLWHANLIHGGSKRNNIQLTRKSLVSHYFVHGVVTYHDCSGGPARPHSGTCLLRPPADQ